MDMDFGDFETVMAGSLADSYNDFKDLKMSPNKIYGFMKLVGFFDKKILLKKLDFWLPLKSIDKNEDVQEAETIKKSKTELFHLIEKNMKI